MTEGLKKINQTPEWLESELLDRGIPNPQAVLYAEWRDSDGLEVQTYKSAKN